MKRILIVLAVVISVFAFASCEGSRMDREEEVDLEGTQAKRYFDNINRIVRLSVIDSDRKITLEQATQYSVFDNLRAIYIEDENGRRISFFDLDTDSQRVLIDRYTDFQALLLYRKTKYAPELNDYLDKLSDTMEKVLNSRLIQIGNSSFISPIALLGLVTDAVDSFKNNIIALGRDESERALLRLADSTVRHPVPFAIAHEVLAGKAKKGDILIAAPWHQHPSTLINFMTLDEDVHTFQIGHTEILLDDFTAKTAETDTIVVGAQLVGVVPNTMEVFGCQLYHLRLRQYKYVMHDGDFEVKEVDIPRYKLPEKASEYVGKRFLEYYEFPFMKALAPEAFVCSSLCWYCTLQEFGIDLSNWFSSMVAPSDIILDDNTSIENVVE